MRRALIVLAIATAAAGALVARASSDLTQTALDALTPIESTPGQSQLTSVFGGSGSSAVADAVQALSGIATDSSQDVGVQLRAIRDLGDYPAEPQAHQVLSDMLVAAPATNRGFKVVLLRAAVEAFGALAAGGGAQANDVHVLLPLIGGDGHQPHPSPDIRAATATALGKLCDPAAIQALRDQFGVENVPQVQFAISAALRVLGSCGTGSGSASL